MWLYVWDKSVWKIFEWQDDEVTELSSKTEWIFPEWEWWWADVITFWYTWADQHWTAPSKWELTIECWWAWAIGSKWWYAKWTINVNKWDKFSIVCWSHWNNWGTYWFNGTSNYASNYNWWWLAWVFTWDAAVWVNDAARALVIWWWAGWDWASSRRWWAWGWETWGNWAGWGCGWIWGWWGQTWKSWTWAQWSWQFKWWGPSGTYGSWGWAWWYGWNWNFWDSSGWDDCGAWGWSWYVIASATNRVLTQWGGSNTSTAWKVVLTFKWKEIPRPTYVTSAWAYHNADLWLISISTDWQNWITISDKNVWATVADPENTDSYWDIFQYWNIYHFDWEWSGWTVTTEAQIPDLTGYEWWNLYSNDKYRTNIDWNAANKKLWKPVAFANLLSLQKGPCDRWFHIPSAEEWTAVLNAILELEWEEAEFSYDLIARYLLMAHPNARKGDWDFYSSNTSIYFTNSYIANQNKINAFVMIWDEWSESGWLSATDMNCGGYIRWFRDVAMIPTTEWTRIGGWSTVRLPLEYQEVEYIQSSWTQWIDTWLYWNLNRKFILDTKRSSTLSYWLVFGANSSWWEQLYIRDWNKVYLNWSAVSWVSAPSSNVRHIIEYNTTSWNAYIKLDWTTVASSSWTNTNNKKLTLFWTYETSNAQTPTWYSTKIYSFKWYDTSNNELLRDFVPCYRRIDWAIWMYDLVNDQFYTNAGSWTFSRGNEVWIPELPGQYQEVDYVQSSWTQYIDSWLTLETSARLDNFQMRVKATHTWSWNFAGTKSAVDSPTYMTMEVVGSATTTLRCFIANSSTYTDRAVLHDNNTTIDDIRYTYSSSSAVQVINGTSYSQSRSSWYSTSNKPIYIFARNKWDNAPEQLLSMKLYSCLMVVSWKLERFFVPCYRKSDNTVWLFDLINKEFYTNVWSWTFTKWNAIKYYRRNQNTISFFPFEANTNDVTGNRTVTFSWPTIQDGSLNIPNSASYGTLNSVVNNSVLTISCLYYYWWDATDWKWNTLFAHIWGSYHHILFPAHTDSWTIGNIWFYNSGWNPSSKTLTKNKWYHIVTTKNWTNQKMYVNWVLVQNATSFNNAMSWCELWMICNYNSWQKQWPIWKMKEVVFENVEWNLDRVQELYNMYKQDFNLD